MELAAQKPINTSRIIRLLMEKLREDIDKIDNGILQLVAKRMKPAKEIAEIKKNNNLPLEDKKREDELIKSRIKKMKELGFDDAEFVKQLFTLLMGKSKEIQKGIMEKK